MIRTIGRIAVCCLSAVTMLVATAPAALADAAGPTDYRTDIVAVEPASAPIKVEMIGGDSFLSLEQLEPVEVIVLGYQAEPYLRFDPDGTVYENRRSPAVWLNQERYGTEELPAFADAEARPEWFEVAANGRYSWHDHRSHWMNPQPPPSAEPGDQVLEATVPLRVDGETVTITVASFLLDGPSPLSAIVGVGLGLAATAAVWRANRMSQALIALLAAGAATLFGTVAYRSVPSETEPSQLLWLLPTIALVAPLVVIVARNHTATTVYLDGLLVAAGCTLAGWGFFRFDALQRALIPSDTPASLDRVVIATALGAGAILALRGFAGLARPERLLTPADTTA